MLTTQLNDSPQRVRPSRVRVGAVLLILAVACLAAGAQAPGGPLYARNYAEQLPGLLAQADAMVEDPVAAFPLLVYAAICLQKTGTGEGAEGRRFREALAPSADASRYFEASVLLLRGELRGVLMLAEGQTPDLLQVRRNIVPLLAAHGFADAAGLCTVALALFPEFRSAPTAPRSMEGVKAWLGLSATTRQAVDARMAVILEKDASVRKAVARDAFDLCVALKTGRYIEGPREGLDANDAFALAEHCGGRQGHRDIPDGAAVRAPQGGRHANDEA